MWTKIVIALILLLVGAAELALAFAFFWRVPVAYRPFRFDAEEVERVSMYWVEKKPDQPSITRCTRLADREDIAEICDYLSDLSLREAKPTTYDQSIRYYADLTLNIHLRNGRVRKLAFCELDLLQYEVNGWFSTDEESIIYNCDSYTMSQFFLLYRDHARSVIAESYPEDYRPGYLKYLKYPEKR